MEMTKSASWIFANNLKRLIEERNWTRAEAAREWKLPPMTLYNAVTLHSCPSLDTAEHIALSSGYQLWQMLMPEFDPGNPPVVRSIGSDESAFYSKLSELVKKEFAK